MRSFILVTILSLTSAFTMHSTVRPAFLLRLHPDQAAELEQCADDHFIQKIAEAPHKECPPKANVLDWCRSMIASDNAVNESNKTELQHAK
jgi:hypothetical protein